MSVRAHPRRMGGQVGHPFQHNELVISSVLSPGEGEPESGWEGFPEDAVIRWEDEGLIPRCRKEGRGNVLVGGPRYAELRGSLSQANAFRPASGRCVRPGQC